MLVLHQPGARCRPDLTHMGCCIFPASSVPRRSCPTEGNSDTFLRGRPTDLTLYRESTLLMRSESEAELLYDWRFTAHQFVLSMSLLRLTTRNFIADAVEYGPEIRQESDWIWFFVGLGNLQWRAEGPAKSAGRCSPSAWKCLLGTPNTACRLSWLHRALALCPSMENTPRLLTGGDKS
jgi:hypothetical protein